MQQASVHGGNFCHHEIAQLLTRFPHKWVAPTLLERLYLDELTDCVPEVAIPLSPAAPKVRKRANLVQAIGIPSLGYQLGAPQNRILADHLYERWI